MAHFTPNIVCCYLYPITKYGYPPPASGTLTYIEEMAELGFSSIELEGIRKNHLLEMETMVPEILPALNSNKLKVPYYCAVLPGLSSPEEKIRRENLNLFETGCKTAWSLGSTGILDNGPLPPYQFPDDIPVTRHYDTHILLNAHLPKGMNWEYYYDALADTYRQACQIADRYHLTYQLHPCLGVRTSTTDGFLRFADAVAADNLRFNFDTANLFAVRENLLVSYQQVKDRVDYIHVSDNDGSKIEHLPVGQGSIDFKSFFESLKENNFKGHIGIDVGGAESNVSDLDTAYVDSATIISSYIHNK